MNPSHNSPLDIRPRAILLIEDLLSGNPEFENTILAWIKNVLSCDKIQSFVHLADNEEYLIRLSKKTNLYNAIPLSPFISEANISNYVTHLQEIWKDLKNFPIYSLFSSYLHTRLNSNFVFESDFESVLYSYPEFIFGIIMIVTILTILLVNQEEEEENLDIFSNLDDLPPELKGFLQATIKKIVSLFDDVISLASEPAIGMTSICNLGVATGLESRRRITTVNDIQIYKKVDDQQLIIDGIKKENEELLSNQSDLQNKIKEMTMVVADQERTIQNLTFSKNDLLSKLRTHTLTLEQDAVKDREEEIKRLKEILKQKETIFKGSIRELEDDREHLHKKIHQLENYKIEFENNSKRTISTNFDACERLDMSAKTSDEVKELRLKCSKLEEICLKDKERCLYLEMEIVRLNKDLDNTRNDKREVEFKFREMASLSQIHNISDLSDENYADIAEELSSVKVLEKLNNCLSKISKNEETSYHMQQSKEKAKLLLSPCNENNPNSLNSTSSTINVIQNEVRISFVNYEKKCLNKIKAILKTIEESKENLKDISKENEELKSYIEELQEKAHDLENMALDTVFNRNYDLRSLVGSFDDAKKDQNSIAQDLLKTIMKKDLEIARLNQSKRRLYNETLLSEGRCLESNSLMYSVIQAYINC
jgi:hypothetical protein